MEVKEANKKTEHTTNLKLLKGLNVNTGPSSEGDHIHTNEKNEQNMSSIHDDLFTAPEVKYSSLGLCFVPDIKLFEVDLTELTTKRDKIDFLKENLQSEEEREKVQSEEKGNLLFEKEEKSIYLKKQSPQKGERNNTLSYGKTNTIKQEKTKRISLGKTSISEYAGNLMSNHEANGPCIAVTGFRLTSSEISSWRLLGGSIASAATKSTTADVDLSVSCTHLVATGITRTAKVSLSYFTYSYSFFLRLQEAYLLLAEIGFWTRLL